MRIKSTLLGLAVVAALTLGGNAYADGSDPNANCPVHGFFNSVGGFLYNAMPWNWNNWMGK